MAMKTNRVLIPEAKLRANKFKIEIANEVGANNNRSMDNGSLASRQNGNKVKSMIEAYERGLI